MIPAKPSFDVREGDTILTPGGPAKVLQRRLNANGTVSLRTTLGWFTFTEGEAVYLDDEEAS